MPKYACEPAYWEGVVLHPPNDGVCDFLDAEGKLIGKPAVYVDTDLGIVIAHIQQGGMTKMWNKGTREGPVFEVTLHKAPLTCIPHEGKK